MEGRKHTALDELSPNELRKFIEPGLRACRTQVERDKFAKAILDTTRKQIDAAIYLDDLWGEFEYLEAGQYIGHIISEALYGPNRLDFYE
jgi:hypothetical protein